MSSSREIYEAAVEEINKKLPSPIDNPINKEKLFERMSYYENINFDFSELDEFFRKEFGIDYQVLKKILITFYEKGIFRSVVQKYLQTNHDFYGNVSYEYNDIFADLVKSGKIKIKS